VPVAEICDLDNVGSVIKRFVGFRDFVFRGNVIDLAVAVIAGAAFTKIVDALAKGILTPLIASILGDQNYSQLNRGRFLWGDVVSAVIHFLIVAAVLYFVIVIPMKRIMDLQKDTKEATERTCPECLSDIPLGAHRCRYCTAEVPEVPTPTS
jgi:large conductance mechanosensitive channel